MTPEQFNALINVLGKLQSELAAQGKYTITGAADWPLLTVVGGAVVALVVFMWLDLKAAIKEGRNEWKAELAKEVNLLWSETRKIREEHKECYEKCVEDRR